MDDQTDIFAALDAFAAPLAVLTPDGATLHVNDTLARRYGEASPAMIVRADLGSLSVGAPRETTVTVQAGARAALETRALALRLRDQHLLILEDQLGPELENEVERLREYVGRLEQVAATDHMTGAWNRAQFDRLVAAELAQDPEHAQLLSLILLDVDHFKRVNDTHGHAAGDAVLRSVARVLEGGIRRSDRLFRWGGEEFAILLTGAGYRGARRVAEKVRLAIAAHTFDVVGRVTLSAGVAERCPGETLESWFERLDRALYAAKAAGRNRSVVDPRGLSDARTATAPSAPPLRLQWQEAYECGDPVIDDQHRELFGLANALLAAAASNSGQTIPSLEALIAHVRGHFADEEAILEGAGYPGLDMHKRAHRRLLARAGRLHHAALRGRVRLGELVEYLAQQVIANHLLTMDRDYRAFLGARP